MQKAKVGDLIYVKFGKHSAYMDVTELDETGVWGNRLGRNNIQHALDGDYQIVFSPKEASEPERANVGDFIRPHSPLELIGMLDKAVAVERVLPNGVLVDGGYKDMPDVKKEIPHGYYTIVKRAEGKQAERALIGDKVQGLGGFREIGTGIWKVVRLWDGGVFVDMDGRDAFLPDGYYVVVERKGNKQYAHCVTPGLNVDIPAPADTPFLKRHREKRLLLADTPSAELSEELRRRGDDVKKEDMLYCRRHGRVHNSDCQECHEWMDARLEWSGEKFGATALIAMLANRTGVTMLNNPLRETKAEISYFDVLTNCRMTYALYGPVAILVIPEAAK